MHDFAITPRHTLFMDLPLTISPKRMLRGGPLLKFEPERGARFGVLPRYGSGQDIKWFEVSPCYVFHTLNAYDDGDEVVLLACRTEELPDSLYMPPSASTGHTAIIGDGFAPVMYRWRLNLKTGAVQEEALDDMATDFPRINEHLLGSQARYGYTVGIKQPNELLKYDFKGVGERHDHGSLRIGERRLRAAAGRPSGRRWLASSPMCTMRGWHSELIVIEAQDSARRRWPCAIPARVPYGFTECGFPARCLPPKTNPIKPLKLHACSAGASQKRFRHRCQLIRERERNFAASCTVLFLRKRSARAACSRW